MIHYKKGALIYIEHIHNDEFNKVITQNHDFIVDVFNRIDIPFVYLPKLLTDSHFNSVLGYNHPYLKEPHHNYSDKLYHVISNSLNLTIDGPTLIHLSDKGEVTHQFAVTTYEVFISPNKLILFAEHIYNTIHPPINEAKYIEESSDVLFRRTNKAKEDDSDDVLYRDFKDEHFSLNDTFDSLAERLPTKSYKKKTALDSFKKMNPDDLFEEKAFAIPHDLQKQIEALSEAGYLSHLIKHLEILQQTTRTLSRLKITDDYRIYLMDYEMKEVKMSPLPKALYLLFLNHPEGISFKELTDYRAELLNIYKNISLRENPIKARISIRKLTDPFDNSVHEKCSRIRAAFLRVVAEDIAENYYITGGRGENKKVILDRELLIYDK